MGQPFNRQPPPVVQVQVPVDDLTQLLNIISINVVERRLSPEDREMIERLQRKAGLYRMLKKP